MPATFEAGGGDSRGVRLTRAALAIALFTVLTRVLGFGEKLAIAAVFGTDWSTDVWFVLVSVPTLLFLFVRELSEPVLLPALVGHLDEGRRARALGILRLFLWAVGGLVSLLAVAIALAPMPALGVLAPGFEPAVISHTPTSRSRPPVPPTRQRSGCARFPRLPALPPLSLRRLPGHLTPRRCRRWAAGAGGRRRPARYANPGLKCYLTTREVRTPQCKHCLGNK